MIIERINKGLLLGLLLVCSGIVQAQLYPENGEKVNFNSTEMVNENIKTITMGGCVSSPCDTRYKKVNLIIDFSLADDFADITGGGSAISSGVDVIITANKCSFLSQPPYTLTKHLEIDTDNPRQVFQLDFTSVYLSLDDIEITVENYSVPVGYESSVELNVGYEGEFLFPVGYKTISATAVGNVDPTTNSAKEFSWTVDCGHYAMYEFQLLKLENSSLLNAQTNNPATVTANVDWSKALTIHTYSWEKFIRLTLTEGTGYYTWRVRGIGNQYPHDEANPKNWDVWSAHIPNGLLAINPNSYVAQPHTFYYNQFDEDKNWNYSRVFVEGERDYAQGVRIGEQIGYANGLLQAKQSQSILNTNNQVVASESVQDYSGRASLNSIAAPVYGQSSLGFKDGFFLSSADGTAYDASDFDSDANYLDPTAVKLNGAANGFGYYSDYNAIDTYVASAADPLDDTRGYPFARTSFYNDGRAKESSGVGYDHRLQSDFSIARTTKMFYGSVSDDELLRVLGNEAPDAGSVHKIMTIDPNKTVHLSYVNKAGQTLFTCLSMPATNDYSLLALDSQADAIYSVTEKVDPLIKTSDNIMERVKTLLLPFPTNVNIEYNLTTNVIEDFCANFCTSCDYELFIKVVNLETNTTVYEDSVEINPAAACTAGIITLTHTESLSAGHYQIVQRLVANNLVSGSLMTQLETHLDELETSLTNAVLGGFGYTTAHLYDVMEFLDNNQLDALYDYLNTHPNATLMTDVNGDEYYNFSIEVDGTECEVIKIPVLDCLGSQCAETVGEFTDFMTDYGYTEDILTYEYAQGLVHTYTVPEFEDLIRNMNLDGYTWCQLWNCWTSLILSHENSLQVQADMNATPQGANYEYNPINAFLDCARGTRYSDGVFPMLDATIINGVPESTLGYITSAHNYFYYEDGTYTNCLGFLTADPTDVSNNSDIDIFSFYQCINHIDEAGAGAIVLEEIIGSIGDACEQSCESKRDLFRNEILNLYHAQGDIIEEDDYIFVAQTIAGSVQWVPNYNDPLTFGYSYDHSLAEIECAVDVLVESCKENCTVSNPITATEEQNIQNILNGSINVYIPGDEGCRDDLSASSAAIPEFLISWDRAEEDAFIHSASEESSMLDLAKDGGGHIALLAGNKLSKYNTGGQLIWSKTYDLEVNSRTIRSVSAVQGGYLISTDGYQIALLNGNGNVAWIYDYSVEIGVTGEQLTSSVEVNDNGEVFALWYVQSGGSYHDVLAKVDLSGNFDWFYDYDAATTSGFVKAVLCPMGADILVGSVNGTEVYSIDNSGVLAWNADPGFTEAFSNIRSIKQIAYNDWAIIGNDASNNAKIYGVSNLGIVANSGIPMNLSGEEGYDLAQTGNGNFAILTEEDVFGVGIQFHVTHLGYGIIEWDEHFGSADTEYNPMLLCLDNGAFIIGGTSTAGTTNPGTYKTETINPDIIWEAWTVKFRYHNTDCHPIEFCIEWIPFELIDFGDPTDTIIFMTCEEVQSNILRSSILNQVSTYIESIKTEFKANYNEQCLIPENIDDELTLTYKMAGYHYMVYYYDRAGNLIKTVPPQGVQLQDLTLPAVQNRTTIPIHTHVTDYQYNSLGQMTRSHTPDGGETKFYYDDLSRLRFSQDAYQLANNLYSYMKYDELGRVIEGGVSTLDAVGLGFLAFTENQAYPSSGTSEWTKSVYNTPFSGVEYKGEIQQFLRNRISYVYNEEGAYTYYSYDPHGNVEWLVQEIPGFDRFTVAYDYDLLSGNVLMVSYNDDSDNNPDQFFHRYSYDGDNRMLTTETSTDKVIWDVDQENTYNSVGIMNRKLTGQDQVQGTDYVSTVQGWLKGINHSSLSTEKDPGQDGFANTVGEDAFGMILNYYDGDYRRGTGIGTAYTNTDEQHLVGTHDLYNGNISSWASRIPDQTTGGTDIEHAGSVTGYKYRYDELQRIKNADYYTIDADDPAATWVATNDYHTEYIFDANGNLINLMRNAHSNVPGTDTDMDEIDYVYFEPVDPTVITGAEYLQMNNQLILVGDGLDAGGGIDDIVGLNYYTYDEIGRLTSDVAQDIAEIQWTALQKVSAIIKTGGEIIRFKYDALGNRIAKEFIHPSDPLQNETTYYVLDASGNPMATYTKTQVTTPGGYNNVYHLTEHNIYGSDRVGLFTPQDVVVKEVDQDGIDVTVVLYDRKTELENWNLSMQYEGLIGGSNIQFINELKYNSSTEVTSPNTLTGAFGLAGKNNAVLEDEFGTLVLTASTHRTYNGANNVTVVRDGNGNMILGANFIDAYWEGQSIFVKQPSSTPGPDSYYLMAVNEAGELKAHRIFMNLTSGDYEVSPAVTTIPGTYAQGLAVVDDRSGDFTTQVLALRQDVGAADLVSIGVTTTNGVFGAPTSIQSYAHEIVTGHIAISPNGQQLAVSTEQEITFDTGWMTITFPFTGILNYDYTDYATVSSPTVNVLGSFTRCHAISYTALNDYLYFAKEESGANGIYRWDLSANSLVYSAEIGTVRRGASQKVYALKEDDTDSNNDIRIVTGPSSGLTITSPQTIVPTSTWDNYVKANIPLQPHVIKDGSPENLFTRTIGNKMYELKDHLGNVRTVVTDRKLYDGSNYTAQIISIADYYPFGMQMPGRQQIANIYRYGFQGQEKDDEVKGEGNSVNYKYRMHDPRIGRFFAEDPLKAEYPHNSPYAFSENMVVHMIELEGLEAKAPKNTEKKQASKGMFNDYLLWLGEAHKEVINFTVKSSTTIVKTATKSTVKFATTQLKSDVKFVKAAVKSDVKFVKAAVKSTVAAAEVVVESNIQAGEAYSQFMFYQAERSKLEMKVGVEGKPVSVPGSSMFVINMYEKKATLTVDGWKTTLGKTGEVKLISMDGSTLFIGGKADLSLNKDLETVANYKLGTLFGTAGYKGSYNFESNEFEGYFDLGHEVKTPSIFGINGYATLSLSFRLH